MGRSEKTTMSMPQNRPLVSQNGPWQIKCSRDQFEKLREDAAFLSILRLCRCTNALFFFRQTLMDADKNNFPDSKRQTINSFLYVLSVLYESLRIVGDVRKHFSGLPSFETGLGALQGDKMVRHLYEQILRRARHKTAFHFDEDVAAEAAMNFSHDEYAFVVGRNRDTIDPYYDLADFLFVDFVFLNESGESEDDSLKKMESLFRDLSDLIPKFANASQNLIGDVVKNWVKEGKLSGEPFVEKESQ